MTDHDPGDEDRSEPFPVEFTVRGIKPGETPSTRVLYTYKTTDDIEGWLNRLSATHGRTMDVTIDNEKQTIEVVFW